MAKRGGPGVPYDDETRYKAKMLWLTGNYTDKQIATILGLPRDKTIIAWRKRENWEADRRQVEKEAERRVSSVISESVADMRVRHVKGYKALQYKAARSLAEHEILPPRVAAKIMDMAIKGEERIRGEDHTRHDFTMVMDRNLSMIEDMTADLIRRFVDEGKLNRKDAMEFLEMFAEAMSRIDFAYESDLWDDDD